MMPTKCCVPFCNSNYDSSKEYISIFRLPKEFRRRRQWLSQIGRKNFTPSKQTGVCIKHFEEHFIIREECYLTDDKRLILEPRYRIMLTPDAYPTIFNYKPSSSTIVNDKNTKSKSSKRKEAAFNRKASSSTLDNDESSESEPPKQPSVTEDDYPTFFNYYKESSCTLVEDESGEPEDEELESEENSEHWINEDDKIGDISDFQLHYQSKLLSNWLTLPSDDDIYIAKVNLESTPELLITLKINNDLTFNVWYKNTPVKSSEFQWLFGKRLKLESWTKFECLIQHLNETDCSSLDLQLKGIRDTLEDCARKCNDKKVLTKLLIIAEHVKFLSFVKPVTKNENDKEYKPSRKARKTITRVTGGCSKFNNCRS